MTYYNTTHVSHETLRRYRTGADSQQARVLAHFRRHPNTAWSADAVWVRLGKEEPLTSIRRAISDLAQEGHLIKDPRYVEGIYGRPVGQWRLRT